jgi:hypothetical protein
MRQENRLFEAALARQRNAWRSGPSESEGPGTLDLVDVAWGTQDGKYDQLKEKRDSNSKSQYTAKVTSHCT